MAYNTPELLLVGAAQNIVLGFVDAKELEIQCLDPDTTSYNRGPECTSW